MAETPHNHDVPAERTINGLMDRAPPPPPEAGLVTYAVIDAQTHSFLRQGYCPPDVVADRAGEGQIAVRTSGILDFSKYKYENGEVVLLTNTPSALPETVETPDSLVFVMDALPGTQVTLAGGEVISEVAGKITVPFSRSGDHKIRVTTPGYKPVTTTVQVLPLSEKKKRLKDAADAERDSSLKATVTVDGNQYHADDAMQITALTLGFKALAARGTPEEATFSAKVITADNKVATLNAAQTVRLVNRIAKEREDVFIAARQRKDKIDAETVPGGVVQPSTKV